VPVPSKLQHEQHQHVEYFRKMLLRRRLLHWSLPGTVYVPFIGDGDLAVELYPDRKVLGADIDQERVDVAASRINGQSRIIQADCNDWPFPGARDHFAVGDFDPYADPYPSFTSWWENTRRKKRLVVTFTDGVHVGVTYSGNWTKPDGTKLWLPVEERAGAYQHYLSKHVWPWFEGYIKPYQMAHQMCYRRGLVVYWGAVLRRS
jgi:hypothetical protein